MRSVIELQDVSVFRGESAILDRVTWRVEAGQHWVVLGPNGSGKTTLLNVLAGHLGPDRGTATVLGRRHGWTWSWGRAGVGLVSSSLLARIPGRRSVRDVLVSGDGPVGALRRIFADDGRRAGRVLRLVDCPGMAGRRWSTLSQGEKQRVLIGRALMAKPRVLVLDEPCAGLDVVSRERFLRFLRLLGRREGGMTLLMATHHAEEISPAFGQLLILRRGRVVDAGPLDGALTSDNLSKAFGARLRLERHDGRYRLGLRPA